MDCPRTVLIDMVQEDGKFFFRAEGMPDLELDPLDLVKYNLITQHESIIGLQGGGVIHPGESLFVVR